MTACIETTIAVGCVGFIIGCIVTGLLITAAKT
jgi:hypothetical protein